MKKVAIIAAMHGDEVYGIELYEKFIQRLPELKNYIQLIIGNEGAYNQQTRYVDTDMNRQYQTDGDSHESSEIKRVDRLINVFNPDYIIDIHTTRRDSGVFFISDTVNTKRQRIYDMLDIDVCIMHDRVIKQSLIGNYTSAVSLEYSLTSISDTTTTAFINSLKNLIIGQNSRIHNQRLYKVSQLITSEEWKKYSKLAKYEVKSEGMALMVPRDASEMDAEYFGFWCEKSLRS